jgi:branched-subunit amino acid aminotransferase/4-amino-4-deoxychorismate lyase
MPAELDGVPITADEALALALGNYGHFTSMLVEDGRVKGLDLHLSRLVHDCEAVFGTTPDPGRIRDLVRRATAAAERRVVVRVTMFDPELDLGHAGRAARPRVLVTFRPAPGAAEPPPLRVRSVPYVRELAGVKHAGLFGTLGQRRQALLAGYDDALFTDAAGRISEGATWNVCFADGGQVLWPSAEQLPGVTMRLLRRGLAEIGRPSAQAPVDLVRASRMRAAFATNAVTGLRPVRSIDDVEFPGDPELLAELREAYAKIPGDDL